VPSNRDVIYIGQREEDLTERGVQQTTSIADMLIADMPKNEPLVAIYSSPLRRAAYLGLELAKHFPGIEFSADPRITELHLGMFDGRYEADVRREDEELYFKRQADKYGFVIPGGESYRMLEERVQFFVRDVRQAHPRDSVCVVSHQGTIRALIGVIDPTIPKEHVPCLIIPQDAYIKLTETGTGVIRRVIGDLQTGLEDSL